MLLFTALVALLALPAGSVFAQELEFSGTAVISDDAALGDAIKYTMSGVPEPSAGAEYVGWLVSKSRKLNTGPMSVVENEIFHTFDSGNPRYTGENLIHGFNTVVITEEAAGSDPDEPAGPAVYSHSIPLPAMPHIRYLLSDWPEDTGVGILTNLQIQLGVALQQANLAKDSAAAGNLDSVKRHLEQVVNAIEGPTGPNYGDIDGNGSVEDLSDGMGALSHAADLNHAALAAAAAPGETELNAHAGLLKAHAANVRQWSARGVAQALRIVNADSLGEANVFLGPGGNTVISFLDAALDGNDLSGDGGAKQAYTAAQSMATFTLQAGGPIEENIGEGAGGISFGSVGDPAVPLVAQIGLIAAVMLLAAGGLLLHGRRRSRVRS